MEMSMKMKMIVGMLMMWMVVGEASVTCGSVVKALTPCIPYLTSSTAPITGTCCSGIRTLNGQASTTADRQAACNCLKSIAASIRGINYKAASGLPAKCGVTVPYNISPSTDCSKVH